MGAANNAVRILDLSSPGLTGGPSTPRLHGSIPTRSEAALEPPRFISRMLTHWQAYICPSSSLVMVPGLHPMALRAW
jgi:hypothetical protein